MARSNEDAREAPARTARAAGWVALAGAVGIVLGVFVLPYAGIDVPTRQSRWGLAFSVELGDPALQDGPGRFWFHHMWAWVALAVPPVVVGARWAFGRPATLRAGGFLAGLGLLAGLRILATAGPILRPDLVIPAPGLFVGLGGAMSLVVAGLLAIRTVPPGHRPKATPIMVAPAFALVGAGLFAASTLLPAYVWSGHAGPAEGSSAFPFVRVFEGLAAWPAWVWPAGFVIGVALIAALGAVFAHRTGSGAGDGLSLAAGWTALLFAVGTLSHDAPAAQTAGPGAYVGIAGATLLLVAAGLLAGRGASLPRRGSLPSRS